MCHTPLLIQRVSLNSKTTSENKGFSLIYIQFINTLYDRYEITLITPLHTSTSSKQLLFVKPPLNPQGSEIYKRDIHIIGVGKHRILDWLKYLFLFFVFFFMGPQKILILRPFQLPTKLWFHLLGIMGSDIASL